MSRLLLIVLGSFLVANAAPLETIVNRKRCSVSEKSSELADLSREVLELTYAEELPQWSFFEESDSSAETLSEADKKTLEELILTVTEEHVLNVTEPDPEPTLGQKLKKFYAGFKEKVKNLGTNAKEIVDLVKENIRTIRTQKADPNASEDEVKETAWKKTVYTIKRWLALNEEGKAQLRKNFPRLAAFLDNPKWQKQFCGFSCVVADTKKENKETRKTATET
ncbi:hypothetical protein PMAYCL1PPCAC_28251, partial [Pristionchus mayeri]